MSAESVGDAREVIDANAHVALLDAPNVRLAGADHLGKAVLRKPLAFSSLPDRFSERASFLVDVHAYRICVRLSAVASYMMPFIREYKDGKRVYKMTKIDLQPNEAIILRDSEMKHDRGGRFDSELDELVLTNQALIVVHKNIFGNVKDIQRYALDQVTIANNSPQVVIGMSQNNERQLHVYFRHGIEAFTLGDADEDSDAGILEFLLTPMADKENRNLHNWRSAISQAVLGLPHNAQIGVSQAQQTPAPVQAPASSTAPTPTPTAAPAPAVVASAPTTHTTKKCIGCMAPLSGIQGQKVICKYCDTEQAL